MADLYLQSGESIPLSMTTLFRDLGTHFAKVVSGGSSLEYASQVAEGLITNLSSDDKFGHNPDIDTAAVEDVWDGGGLWVQPTQARIHDLASTSANDTLAGTGARQVTVWGLDGSYALQSETVDLAGTSNAPTTNSYIMIHRMRVIAVGSGGENEGTLTATAQTDATVTAQINPTNNQTLMAIFQVPAATTMNLPSYYGSILKATGNGNANFSLLVKPFGEVWQVRHTLGLQSTGSSYIKHKFEFPKVYSEKTLVKIGKVDVSANDIAMSAGFDFTLKT